MGWSSFASLCAGVARADAVDNVASRFHLEPPRFPQCSRQVCANDARTIDATLRGSQISSEYSVTDFGALFAQPWG
jgi:hypothetical protein